MTLAGSARDARPPRISANRSGTPASRRRAAISSTGQPAQRGVARQQRVFTTVPPLPRPIGSPATPTWTRRSAGDGLGTIRGGPYGADRPRIRGSASVRRDRQLLLGGDLPAARLVLLRPGRGGAR